MNAVLCALELLLDILTLVSLSLASGEAACGLFQPSVLQWATLDCHILGERMFSAWIQQLSWSPCIMQWPNMGAQLFSEGARLPWRRTVWHRLPPGETRALAPHREERPPSLLQSHLLKKAGIGNQALGTLMWPLSFLGGHLHSLWRHCAPMGFNSWPDGTSYSLICHRGDSAKTHFSVGFSCHQAVGLMLKKNRVKAFLGLIHVQESKTLQQI